MHLIRLVGLSKSATLKQVQNMEFLRNIGLYFILQPVTSLRLFNSVVQQ